ncbi:MAG TPA: hypothetical protein VGG46_00165 [Terriglobales bacterium]|jgi:hypothetical protein
MKRAAENDLLVEQLIECFPKHDDMSFLSELDPIAAQLTTGQSDGVNRLRWAPKKIQTDPEQLELLYQKLPAHFPPLYERLVLSYCWAQVDLGIYRLLPNPPGPDFSGLFQQISGDTGLWESLAPGGYIQFGRGADSDYDPVCFDLSARKKNGEYEIVKIDHEEILCNYRIKVAEKMAPSFRELVLQTIGGA